MAIASRARRAAAGASSADPESAREAALRILERSRRTRRELERRLADRGFEPATIAIVLERLSAVGLVDDVEYARAWLAGRWGRRPSGWRRLEQELKSKGLSDDAIAGARERLVTQGSAPDDAESARALLERSRRRYAALDPAVRRQRLYALLARRGYDGETIRRVLALPSAGDEGAAGDQ